MTGLVRREAWSASVRRPRGSLRAPFHPLSIAPGSVRSCAPTSGWCRACSSSSRWCCSSSPTGIDQAAYHERPVTSAVVGQHRRGRRGPPGPHRPGCRGHHRGRRGVLGDDRGPDPGHQPVRAPDAAQLHPRPGHAGHAGLLRGHLRLRILALGSIGHGRARHLRPAPVGHRRAGAGAGRPAGAHLLHPPRGHLDPAARRSSGASPRTCAGRSTSELPTSARCVVAEGAIRRSTPSWPRWPRRPVQVPAADQRLPPVRQPSPAGARRRRARRGGRAAGPARPLRRPPGVPLARVRPPEAVDPSPTELHRVARHRAAANPDPGPGLRHRPAGRDRHPGAVAGGQRHLHRADLHRLAGRRPGRHHPALGHRPARHRDARTARSG